MLRLSSSSIRSQLRQSGDGQARQVEGVIPSVAEYINNNRLYLSAPA